MRHNTHILLQIFPSINLVFHHKDIVAASKFENSSMVGVGITPEGINQNYVLYEFALERAWDYNSVNLQEWFDQYAFSRYGVRNSYIISAWNKLVVSTSGIQFLSSSCEQFAMRNVEHSLNSTCLYVQLEKRLLLSGNS